MEKSFTCLDFRKIHCSQYRQIPLPSENLWFEITGISQTKVWRDSLLRIVSASLDIPLSDIFHRGPCLIDVGVCSDRVKKLVAQVKFCIVPSFPLYDSVMWFLPISLTHSLLQLPSCGWVVSIYTLLFLPHTERLFARIAILRKLRSV